MSSSLCGPAAGAATLQEKRSPFVASDETTYVNSASRNIDISWQQYGKLARFNSSKSPTSCHGCSDSSGWRALNDFGPVITQLFGILLIATSQSWSTLCIISTDPWFRIASCSFLMKAKLPDSHGCTEADNSFMDAFSRWWVMVCKHPFWVDQGSYLDLTSGSNNGAGCTSVSSMIILSREARPQTVPASSRNRNARKLGGALLSRFAKG
mmetsp:Transcript_32512/g.64050  ORF Transcript_32512/g.64050 Transcript_32512/m.64050 type:complete len:210 (-) Transcript_32512:17-646(-)